MFISDMPIILVLGLLICKGILLISFFFFGFFVFLLLTIPHVHSNVRALGKQKEKEPDISLEIFKENLGLARVIEKIEKI
jgi:predicted RND superfamily exporter protein